MNPLTARYLNRASDLLFILARYANRDRGDVLWQPGGPGAEATGSTLTCRRRSAEPVRVPVGPPPARPAGRSGPSGLSATSTGRPASRACDHQVAGEQGVGLGAGRLAAGHAPRTGGRSKARLGRSDRENTRNHSRLSPR